MSDDSNNKPTLTRKPLTLSRSLESGEVKQTFSHGRTNKVVVEVKRKKLVGKPGYAPEAEVAAPPPPPPPPAAPVAAAPAPAPKPAANDMLSRQERQAKLLREAEEARLAMLEESSRREAEQRAQRSEEEKQRAQANREEAAAPPPPPPAAAAPVEPETFEPVAEEANKDGAAPAPRRFTPVEAPKRPEREREEAKKAPHRPTRGAADDRRQSGKLTLKAMTARVRVRWRR
jgi:translation initiation factor IF-2